MSENYYAQTVVVDGLQAARWSREVFEDMRNAGITAVNCTCCIWEGVDDTLNNVAAFARWFHEHDDLIRPVHTVADIAAAKEEGRVGVILGWQNTSGFGDRIELVELFGRLGLRVVQLTYNTQNLAGSGCYESRDSGLSDFGRELVAELNRAGIVIDLSHVGAVTAREAIACSEQPVVFSHTCPAALHPHPRNKTDEEMRSVAERGGLVGVTLYPWFLRPDGIATLDDYANAIEYTVGVVGEDHVALGTDFMDGQPEEFFEWIFRDKGSARRLVDTSATAIAKALTPEGIAGIRDFPRIVEHLEQRGWPEDRLRKLVGGNWCRLFAAVWGNDVVTNAV
jgi:membrane dipeptidase